MSIDPQAVAPLRTWNHGSQLTCCQFMPQGKGLVAAGHDGSLYRLDMEGNESRSLAAHQGWIVALRWTPNHSRLLSADSWGRVCAWQRVDDWFEPQPAWTIPCACASWLRDLALSADGKLLATCGNEPIVRVYSVHDGQLVHELRGHEQPVMSVAFAPDGKRLVSGDLLGNICDWNLEQGQCQRQFSAERLYKTFYQYRQGGVRSLAFSADGKTLYAAGFEGTNANQAQGNPLVLTFDWESAQPTTTLVPTPTVNGPITDVVIHPAGFIMAASSSEGGGVLWIWRPGEEKNVHHLKHSTSFRRLAIADDGRQLAVAAFGNLDGQRGGNGRRLDKEGNYPDFGGMLVLYHWK